MYVVAPVSSSAFAPFFSTAATFLAFLHGSDAILGSGSPLPHLSILNDWPGPVMCEVDSASTVSSPSSSPYEHTTMLILLKTKSFLQLLPRQCLQAIIGAVLHSHLYVDRKVFNASSICIMKCSVPPLVVTCFKFLALMGAHVGVGGGGCRALWRTSDMR